MLMCQNYHLILHYINMRPVSFSSPDVHTAALTIFMKGFRRTFLSDSTFLSPASSSSFCAAVGEKRIFCKYRKLELIPQTALQDKLFMGFQSSFFCNVKMKHRRNVKQPFLRMFCATSDPH